MRTGYAGYKEIKQIKKAKGLIQRVKYWIFKGDKQCHSCCVVCKFYKDCSYERV